MVMFEQIGPEVAGVDAVETTALIARVRAGDQAAARELVARLRHTVLRIARRHRPRRTTEEDILQEVFMKIFARLGQYRGEAPFDHWASRIATTTCMDQLRAQRCRPEWRLADLSEDEALAVETTSRDPRAPRPGHALATHELLGQLLDRLRPEDRRLIVWFDLEDRTIAEIEDLTGYGFDFIKMRLFRARRKLKRFYANLPGFDGAAATRSNAIRWSCVARKSAAGARRCAPRLAAGAGMSACAPSSSRCAHRVAELASSRPLDAPLCAA